MTDFTELVDLAAEALGGTVIAANDEFFAPKEGLLKPTPAEWREGAYTERGKWMDGWETRRRRTPGHDWAIIHLGAPGIVRGVVIDTSFYRGNYPDRASIEGCEIEGTPSPDELVNSAHWRTLLPESALQGDAQNKFAIGDDERVTHLRLNIFPDGGVARLRVYGDVKLASLRDVDATFDLAAIENGGYSVVCSDMFFGHRQNLIMPGRSTHMGNGWETKRRRGPGHDWTIIRLAQPGVVESVELDTDYYKGNAPDSCRLECIFLPEATADALTDSALEWIEIVPASKLQPHTRHRFAPNVAAPATHVRLNIYPDGGVARLRLLGRRALAIAK
ncbi:MAG: allantoicase [bacterium]